MKTKGWVAIATAALIAAAVVIWNVKDGGSSALAEGNLSVSAVVSPTMVDAPTGTSFNPYPFYSQSCGPNETCIWDVGTMGSLLFNGSPATQVGIVKGVSVEWDGKVANAGPSGRCSLVVLTPNSWFENLTTTDVNVTLYNVYTSANDVAGWMKTLAVQAAQEQAADYGCPMKSYPDDFDIWGSSVSSPPCGVEGFDNCTDTSGRTNVGSDQNSGACETLDCKTRKATVDHGGKLSFKKGDAVAGFEIVLSNGERFSNCFFQSAPSAGTVTDGVVHPWTPEIRNLEACS